MHLSHNFSFPGCNFSTIAPWDYIASTCLILICTASSIFNLWVHCATYCKQLLSSSPHISVKYMYFLLQLRINWFESRMSLLIVSDRSQPLGWGVQWEFHYTLPCFIYHLGTLIKTNRLDARATSTPCMPYQIASVFSMNEWLTVTYLQKLPMVYLSKCKILENSIS